MSDKFYCANAENNDGLRCQHQCKLCEEISLNRYKDYAVGLIPFSNNITQEQILSEIARYKLRNPKDERSVTDLWPHAVNQIILYNSAKK